MTTQTEQKKCDNCSEFGECCQTQPEQRSANEHLEPVAWIDSVMLQAQVFAETLSKAESPWHGTILEDAEVEKEKLKSLLSTPQPKKPEQEQLCYCGDIYNLGVIHRDDGPCHYPDHKEPEQEPVAWRNAAIRVGEDLCSVGPFGYYDMTASQWLDWALSVVTTHAPPQRTWVGLDWNEMPEIYMNDKAFEHGVQWAETKLKEKNTK